MIPEFFSMFKRAFSKIAFQPTYQVWNHRTAILSDKLSTCTQLKDEYVSLLPRLSPSQRQCTRLKVRAFWISDSNRIEGAGLSRGDTIFFLQVRSYIFLYSTLC
jgi:hypothetical protein